MAVPKQKKTRGRINQRRMHIFIKKPSLTICSKCGKPALPHIVCLSCGYYKGREIIDVFKKLNKKEKKQKKREMKTNERQQNKDSSDKERSLTMEGLSKE